MRLSLDSLFAAIMLIAFSLTHADELQSNPDLSNLGEPHSSDQTDSQSDDQNAAHLLAAKPI